MSAQSTYITFILSQQYVMIAACYFKSQTELGVTRERVRQLYDRGMDEIANHAQGVKVEAEGEAE